MQTERMQFAQKMPRKKPTGEKHICLYFSCDIHPILPTFIKLTFKTVHEVALTTSKGRLFQLFTTVIEKMLTYCCFEGWFFQLEIMPLSYRIIINYK